MLLPTHGRVLCTALGIFHTAVERDHNNLHMSPWESQLASAASLREVLMEQLTAVESKARRPTPPTPSSHTHPWRDTE